MLGVLTLFAARLGPYYPANHSPSKIETKTNRENLQVTAGVVLCLEPMRVLEQVHRNAVNMLSREIIHEMMQKARTMFAWADIPKELFKTL